MPGALAMADAAHLGVTLRVFASASIDALSGTWVPLLATRRGRNPENVVGAPTRV